MSDKQKNMDKDPIVLIVSIVVIGAMLLFLIGSVLFGGGGPIQQVP